MEPLLIARLAYCIFFAILFVQSGIDKVIDFKGNLGWLTGHFANSPLRGMVPLLLVTLTLIELAAGVLSIVAAVMIALGQAGFWPSLALGAVALSFLALFFGQRLAKDYAGAASIATYFAVLIGAFIIEILNSFRP